MIALAILSFAQGSALTTPQFVDACLIAPSIAMIHVNEGYVKHHGLGQKHTDDQVVIAPLNLGLATGASNYRVGGQSALRVGRKSKGTDFAWFTDRWVGDHFENDRPDHTKEHWLYVMLPSAVVASGSATLSLPKGICDKQIVKLDGSMRSEALHVNLLGYVPDAPAKFGYLYHWAGDLGSVDYAPFVGKPFRLLDEQGKSVFEGKVAFRKKRSEPETAHVQESKPYGNYLNADVYECDFSTFKTPETFKLKVDGIGTSFPFKIGPNVLREAYVATTRSLYHNRSGIELKKPYTEFARPAPHSPALTPGFKGKLVYTTSRMLDWKTADSTPEDKAAMETGIKGPLDAGGWYQDAGDWDSYPTHLRVATELLMAFQIAPDNFRDGDLNLPESGNGIPDILDEAMWLPRFGYRLRSELLAKKYGTGGLSLRVCGDQFGADGEGTPSWKDVNRTWIVAGEDPMSTFRYAGAAAHVALVLKSQGLSDPEKVDWKKEAVESYRWALAHTLAKDEAVVKDHRTYAAAALFALTDDAAYETQLKKDWADIQEWTIYWGDQQYGLGLYALAAAKADPALMKRVRGAVLATANAHGLESASKRALRWGGDFNMPMLIGQQTTPLIPEVAVAMKLTEKSDPEKSRSYRSVLFTTADYFLGTNALNMVWMTGVGPRNVTQFFHLDFWCLSKFPPGFIPYGPWRKEKPYGNGPWDSHWANKTAYPDIDQWPGNEMWFSNRNSPMSSEFTVHQNSGPAAAFYGILAGSAK